MKKVNGRIVRCIVAAYNANGSPDLYFVKVMADDDDVRHGRHYHAARSAAIDSGYEPRLVFDEHDPAGRAIMDKFEWDTASIVMAKRKGGEL
jgi:hypothetical protein